MGLLTWLDGRAFPRGVAAIVLGSVIGSAGAAAAGPIEARLVADPLAPNTATFVLRNITDPECEPDCPTAETEILLSGTSWVDLSFDRATTEVVLLDGFLEVSDFELGFGPLIRVQVSDVSIVLDQGAGAPSAIIGSDSGPFDAELTGLVTATVRAFGQDLDPIVDQPIDVTVPGVFTFDPELGTFALTDVGGNILPNPFTVLDRTLELTGQVAFDFIATGLLDVFADGFESGDLTAWASFVP